MVYSTGWVVAVARTSADLCQYAACNPERLSSDEALDAIFCLPMRFLSRFAVRVFSFFCFPLDLDPNPRRRPFVQYSYATSSSSSFSDSGSSLDEGYYSAGERYHYHSDWFIIDILYLVLFFFPFCSSAFHCEKKKKIKGSCTDVGISPIFFCTVSGLFTSIWFMVKLGKKKK